MSVLRKQNLSILKSEIYSTDLYFLIVILCKFEIITDDKVTEIFIADNYSMEISIFRTLGGLKIRLYQQLTDTVHDVVGVLAGDARAARQAEAVCINLCRSF